MTKKIAIIGAGPAGMTAAYALSKKKEFPLRYLRLGIKSEECLEQ